MGLSRREQLRVQGTHPRIFGNELRAAWVGIDSGVHSNQFVAAPALVAAAEAAGLAVQLVDATVLGMTPDAPAERWITLLEAAAFSPVHAKVLPPVLPPVVSDELLKTVVRLGPLMPQLAVLFGVTVDPKARAPRPLPAPRPDKANNKKRATDLNKASDAKPGRAKGASQPKSSPAAKQATGADSVPDNALNDADAPQNEAAPSVDSVPANEAPVAPVAEASISE